MRAATLPSSLLETESVPSTNDGTVAGTHRQRQGLNAGLGTLQDQDSMVSESDVGGDTTIVSSSLGPRVQNSLITSSRIHRSKVSTVFL